MLADVARRTRVLLAALVVAVLAVLAGPVSPSWAHAELISSTPADGATLGAVPGSVSLTFSDTIAAQFVRAAVTTPAGTGTVTATTTGPTVTIPVPAAGPGAYRVAYRVVSADGHPVSGTLRFTVAGAPTATGPATGSASASPAASPSTGAATGPAVTSPATSPAAAEGDASDGGSGWVVYAAIAVAVLAGVGALVLAVGRGRRP